MWTFLVWIISAICYVPLFISHQGIAVPSVILNLKYIFVLVPLVFTLVFLLRNKGIKKWLFEMFELRVQAGALVFCLIIAVTGILFTNILTMQEWELQTLLVGMVYLFFMALIEEVVWRGYRLRMVAKNKKEMVAILFVSLEWAVWHIPMWTMRNLIGIGEIAFWILYTVIVGCVLGKSFMRYRNILVPIFLHTIFNVFFLMPVHINMFVVLSILVATIFLEKIEGRLMSFIYIIFIILQWSWGIIQNIVGLVMLLININCKHYYYKGTIVTVWNKEEYCMGIGMFIFISEKCPKASGDNLSLQETFERTRVHEYGHTIQSIILGPVFLLVIGIPSCMWANIPSMKRYRKNNRISYYSFYTEKWANYLGEYVTKCESMGQAMIDF